MPVAANHGAARIMKMNVMRPPYLAWHPQPQYHRVQAYSMLPLKCFASVAGWAQPSLAPHIQWFAAPLVAASEASRKKEILACDVGCHAVLRGWFAIRFAGPQFLLRNLAADHMADF
jgi:hypothetical protein